MSPVLQHDTVQLLIQDSSPKGLELVSRSLPNRIEDALSFPVLKEVVEVAGRVAVLRFIEFEMIRLAQLVNVGQNLTDFQVSFVAEQLLSCYPNETIADFRLCFQRAAIGRYGDVFRLDPIIIGKWMQMYLEEKYQVAETELMKEKDVFKNNLVWKHEVVPDAKAKEYLKQWEQRVLDSKIEVTSDLKKEQPRRGTGYRDTKTPEYYDMRDKIRRAASEFYKDRYSFSKMQVFQIGDYEVFAESKEDAEQIIKQAQL